MLPYNKEEEKKEEIVWNLPKYLQILTNLAYSLYGQAIR